MKTVLMAAMFFSSCAADSGHNPFNRRLCSSWLTFGKPLNCGDDRDVNKNADMNSLMQLESPDSTEMYREINDINVLVPLFLLGACFCSVLCTISLMIFKSSNQRGGEVAIDRPAGCTSSQKIGTNVPKVACETEVCMTMVWECVRDCMVCFISLLKCFELVKCSRRLEVRSLSCTCADALHQRDANYDVKLDILSWHTKIFDIAKNAKRGGCGTRST